MVSATCGKAHIWARSVNSLDNRYMNLQELFPGGETTPWSVLSDRISASNVLAGRTTFTHVNSLVCLLASSRSRKFSRQIFEKMKQKLNRWNPLYMLFAGWEVPMVKNCDLGLENAARGRRPRAAFSRPRSQFFTIRTDRKPANNMFIFFFLQ